MAFQKMAGAAGQAAALPADPVRKRAATRRPRVALSIARREDPAPYAARVVEPPVFVTQALAWLESEIHATPMIGSPGAVRDYLRLRMGTLEHEVFGLLLLNPQHRVIGTEDIFRGTLTQACVYPREVVKLALLRNAAAVICYHNHPSGEPEPSSADRHLTSQLKSALSLIDVQLLDHLVVGRGGAVSFAERGLL